MQVGQTFLFVLFGAENVGERRRLKKQEIGRNACPAITA
jgi:hypothetical protein